MIQVDRAPFPITNIGLSVFSISQISNSGATEAMETLVAVGDVVRTKKTDKELKMCLDVESPEEFHYWYSQKVKKTTEYDFDRGLDRQQTEDLDPASSLSDLTFKSVPKLVLNKALGKGHKYIKENTSKIAAEKNGWTFSESKGPPTSGEESVSLLESRPLGI